MSTLSTASATTHYKLIRTIHPVGQGAFCSEQFFYDKDKCPFFTAVYDCGAHNKNAHARIKQINEFRANVDLLFISHFHDDHINGVLDLLKDKDKVYKIVIPGIKHCRFVVDLIFNYILTTSVVCPSIKLMLACIPALKARRSFQQPIDVREGFAGIKCILPGCSSPSIVMAVAPLAKIQWLYKRRLWHYDADYTVIDTDKEIMLISRLVEVLPSLQTVLSSGDAYLDEDWYESYLLPELERVGIYRLKEIYSKVFGKSHHNSYSMVVHSYPDKLVTKKEMDCLFTGDVVIDKQLETKIRQCHPHYLQVPHHGSKNNHNKSIYYRRQIPFISVGTDNTFGHPSSQVLMDIMNKCPYGHVVTEDPDTEFKQSFTF